MLSQYFFFFSLNIITNICSKYVILMKDYYYDLGYKNLKLLFNKDVAY